MVKKNIGNDIVHVTSESKRILLVIQCNIKTEQEDQLEDLEWNRSNWKIFLQSKRLCHWSLQ